MNEKKPMEIAIIPFICETCGSFIDSYEPRFLLYRHFYHVRCGYNN